MPTDHTGTVFISYSRSHSLRQAKALYQALVGESPAVPAFMDEAAIEPGQAWLKRLEEGLASCSRFVVLVGPEGLNRWVGGEVAAILTRCFGAHSPEDRPEVYPVLMGDTPPSALGGWLAQFQAVHWPSEQNEPPKHLRDALRKSADAAPPTADPRFAGRNPFVGLQALQAEHAPLFFGRERDLAQCLHRLGDSTPPRPGTALGRWAPQGPYRRWLSIEGGSGSGKSSLLRAGLLPMVQAGALSARTGLDDWVVVGPFLPGDDPLTALCSQLAISLQAEPLRDAQALRQRLQDRNQPDALRLWLSDRLGHTPHRGVLLAIDQFEELFTLCPPEQRQHLDALVAHALHTPERQLHLVSTCRSDYAHRIADELPQLARLRQDEGGVWPMAPMSPDEMRRAIQGPARLCGVDVSPVIEALLQDARDDMAGALPLVQQCLSAIYAQEARTQAPVRELHLATYEAEDRLVGSMARRADSVLAALQAQSPQHRAGALALLRALSHWQPDGRHTRQHRPLSVAIRQAGLGSEARGQAVLDTLAGQRSLQTHPDRPPMRLVVVGEATPPRHDTEARLGTAELRVDLIHEALLRSRPGEPPQAYWPSLLTDLNHHKEQQHLEEGLRLAAAAWNAAGRGWRKTASWMELRRWRPVELLAANAERQFLRASRWPARIGLVSLAFTTLVLTVGVPAFAIWTKINKDNSAEWWARNAWATRVSVWWYAQASGDDLLPKAIAIPLGQFTYGCAPQRGDQGTLETCPENEAHRPVDLRTQPGACVAFAQTEVTLAQYDHFVLAAQRSGKPLVEGELPTHPPAPGWGWRRGALPANVNWHEASAYAQWLSEYTGQPWRLPTEEEWEWAARAHHPDRPGGQPGPFWWGQEPLKAKRDAQGRPMANCRNCGPGVGQGPMPVQQFAPNPFGLYDMQGNVWEWTQSRHPKKDTGASTKDSHVVRGGSWFHTSSSARASKRYYVPPDSSGNIIGFRVCRASPIETRASGGAED